VLAWHNYCSGFGGCCILEGSLKMTVKCFWCGASNDKASDYCGTCGRKLQWSSFFNALLRPSVGCLVNDNQSISKDLDPVAANTPIIAA